MTCRPCLKTRCVTCNADYASKVAVLGHMASNITWPGFLGSSVASLLSTAQNDSCGESKPDPFFGCLFPQKLVGIGFDPSPYRYVSTCNPCLFILSHIASTQGPPTVPGCNDGGMGGTLPLLKNGKIKD
jgi:hypothetical protein